MPTDRIYDVPISTIRKGIANMSEGMCPKCNTPFLGGPPLFCEMCDRYYVLVPIGLAPSQLRDSEFGKMIDHTIFSSPTAKDALEIIELIEARQ